MFLKNFLKYDPNMITLCIFSLEKNKLYGAEVLPQERIIIILILLVKKKFKKKINELGKK